jgi:hypothetical protein
MAALTATTSASGDASATYKTSNGSAGADSVANAELIESLSTTSRLYSFLNTATYGSAAAVADAFAALNGFVSAQNASSVAWNVSAGRPVLDVVSVAASPVYVHVQLGYSASN